MWQINVKWISEREMTNQEEIFVIWIIKQISLIYKEPREKNEKKINNLIE